MAVFVFARQSEVNFLNNKLGSVHIAISFLIWHEKFGILVPKVF